MTRVARTETRKLAELEPVKPSPPTPSIAPPTRPSRRRPISPHVSPTLPHLRKPPAPMAPSSPYTATPPMASSSPSCAARTRSFARKWPASTEPELDRPEPTKRARKASDSAKAPGRKKKAGEPEDAERPAEDFVMSVVLLCWVNFVMVNLAAGRSSPEDIQAMLEDTKLRFEKERHNLLKVLSNTSKQQCESSLNEEYTNFQETYERFCKEKKMHMYRLSEITLGRTRRRPATHPSTPSGSMRTPRALPVSNHQSPTILSIITISPCAFVLVYPL